MPFIRYSIRKFLFIHGTTVITIPSNPNVRLTLMVDELAKSRHEDHRWLDKKFDIQGVVFLAGSRQYIEYVESLPKTYNEGDRAFYDAIMVGHGDF